VYPICAIKPGYPARAKKPGDFDRGLQEVQHDGMGQIGASSRVGQSTVKVPRALFRNSQIALGIRPVSIGFISMDSIFRRFNRPISEGTVADSSFPWSESIVSFVSSPSSDGMVPVKPLSFSKSTAVIKCTRNQG